MTMTNTWISSPAHPISHQKIQEAKQRQLSLTKPAGSLGCLEYLAEQFAGWQGNVQPKISHINVAVFAGDHGVCKQHISAFPQAVTTQMVMNFLEGGAAISVLSERLGAEFSVINMGTVRSLPECYLTHPKLEQVLVSQGTNDFSEQAAMTTTELDTALIAGKEVIQRANTIDLFIGGEMGIGNTTSASAIYAAVLHLLPSDVVGPGTGIDAKGMERKIEVIQRSLLLHKAVLDQPYEVLRCFGGLEIAALVGSYIACAQRGVPILVDGFICTAAALLAVKLNPSVRDWMLFSHQSAEPAHRLALDHLSAVPLLNLGMRLGEGSGAAMAVPIVQAALALHSGMATFDQAGVSRDSDE